jgi:hypothetical protein
MTQGQQLTSQETRRSHTLFRLHAPAAQNARNCPTLLLLLLLLLQDQRCLWLHLLQLCVRLLLGLLQQLRAGGEVHPVVYQIPAACSSKFMTLGVLRLYSSRCKHSLILKDAIERAMCQLLAQSHAVLGNCRSCAGCDPNAQPCVDFYWLIPNLSV